LIDTDGNGIEVHNSIFECEIPKKKIKEINKPKEFEQPLKKSQSFMQKISFSKGNSSNSSSMILPRSSEGSLKRKESFFASFSRKPEQKKPEEHISLQEIMTKKRNLKYFKLFATSQFSVENIIFYEEIELYKQIKDEEERALRADKMIEMFFETDSIYEINTSRRLIIGVIDERENGKSPLDLFDVLMSDVMNSNLSDMHQRFIFSEYYKEMKQKNKKKKYFLFE